MEGQAGLLELSAGTVLRLDGAEWTAAVIEPQRGRVLLRAGGDERWRSIRWLMHHPGCQAVPDGAAGPARPAGQPPALEDLTDYQRQVVRLRVAHLLEAETGFRGGDRLLPGPGEPRPAYDPRATTLGRRRRAKAAELKALGAEEAALLGLGQASERTLKRMAAAWRLLGPAGCIDGRWVRAGGGHPSITGEVREAVFAVRAETRDRSRTSMRDKHVLVAQYVAEKFGPQVPVPCYWTLREVWREWFGPGGTRPRYDRTAGGIESSRVNVVVHRPGQVVALDTTPLPVKVRDGVFGDPVSAHLTIALDLFTHSVVAFRLTLVSDTSVDIAMLLRDVMMPLPVRDGWGPEMEWPYPGVPSDVVADFAGHRVAELAGVVVGAAVDAGQRRGDLEPHVGEAAGLGREPQHPQGQPGGLVLEHVLQPHLPVKDIVIAQADAAGGQRGGEALLVAGDLLAGDQGEVGRPAARGGDITCDPLGDVLGLAGRAWVDPQTCRYVAVLGRGLRHGLHDVGVETAGDDVLHQDQAVRRTEVPGQLVLRGVEGGGVLVQRVGQGAGEHHDPLLAVADGGDRGGAEGGLEERQLGAGGVLELVHEHVLVGGAQRPEDLRPGPNEELGQPVDHEEVDVLRRRSADRGRGCPPGAPGPGES